MSGSRHQSTTDLMFAHLMMGMQKGKPIAKQMMKKEAMKYFNPQTSPSLPAISSASCSSSSVQNPSSSRTDSCRSNPSFSNPQCASLPASGFASSLNPIATSDIDLAQAMPASLSSGYTTVDVWANEQIFSDIQSDLAGAGLKLCRLSRIRNNLLEERFNTEKDQLIKSKPPGFLLNVSNLYHGTTADPNQICQEGLDERLGRAGRFGQGIYFSDTPEKCCKYSSKNKINPFLLRCRVILGDIKEYTDGAHDKKLVREPSKCVVDGKTVYYDSVKGKPRDHMEYVIYEKRRAIIEYIAYYERSNVSNPVAESSPIINRVTPRNKSSSVASGCSSDSSESDSADSTPSESDDEDTDTSRGKLSSDAEEVSPPQACQPRKRRKLKKRGSNLVRSVEHSDAVDYYMSMKDSIADEDLKEIILAEYEGDVKTAKNIIEVCFGRSYSQDADVEESLKEVQEIKDVTGKIQPEDMYELIMNFTAKYPSDYSLSDLLASTTKQLIEKFQSCTDCQDTEMSSMYIKKYNGDVNKAVNDYYDQAERN